MTAVVMRVQRLPATAVCLYLVSFEAKCTNYGTNNHHPVKNISPQVNLSMQAKTYWICLNMYTEWESLCLAAPQSTNYSACTHHLDTVCNIVLSPAQPTVGVIPRHSKHNGNHYNRHIVVMACEKRNLCLPISNCRDDQLKVDLKQKWNQLQHEICRLALSHKCNPG